MGNASDRVVDKIKTNFIYNNFFRKSCRILDDVEKYCSTGQAAWQ